MALALAVWAARGMNNKRLTANGIVECIANVEAKLNKLIADCVRPSRVEEPIQQRAECIARYLDQALDTDVRYNEQICPELMEEMKTSQTIHVRGFLRFLRACDETLPIDDEKAQTQILEMVGDRNPYLTPGGIDVLRGVLKLIRAKKVDEVLGHVGYPALWKTLCECEAEPAEAFHKWLVSNRVALEEAFAFANRIELAAGTCEQLLKQSDEATLDTDTDGA